MIKAKSKILPLGSSSENTKNSKLTGILNNLGLEAYFERPIKSGITIDKPDIQIVYSGSVFIVESKQTPATIGEAISKAYKYRESIKQFNIEPKVVFGVLYPKNDIGNYEVQALLHYEPFIIKRKANSLEDLAKIIREFILQPPEIEKIDTSNAIEILRQTVVTLSKALETAKEEEIETIFGGKSVFENILQYKEGEVPLNQLREAAAFLLINQLLFYRILSKETPEDYPDINEDLIKDPNDLNFYFAKVLENNYTATFGFNVASKIPKEFLDNVRNVIRIVKALAPKKLPEDLLGKIFHDLIPLNLRKSVAAYYTNNEAAELLASLSIENYNDIVTDLACGSGTLLVASYHRKKELYKKEYNFTKNIHQEFLESQLIGVDIMPFAAHLAAVHLSLQAPMYKSEKVRIAIWDSTELKPDTNIPALSRELVEAYKRPNLKMFLEPGGFKKKYITKGGISISPEGRSEVELKKSDVVIMNPPFTRQERLPEDYKKKLQSRFNEYKEYIHGQLGYHGYFILLADRFLKTGGTLAMVLPATVFKLGSFEGIRKMLEKKYEIKYVITTSQRAAFSESTQFREILLVAKKVVNGGRDNKMVTIVNLKKMPHNYEETISFANYIKSNKNTKDVSIVVEEQSKFLLNINKYLAESGSQEFFEEILKNKSEFFIGLKDYLESSKFSSIRGVQVWKGDKPFAANMYILRELERAKKQQDKWYVIKDSEKEIIAKNRNSNIEVDISKNCLTYGLRRFSGINKIDISDELDYLIKSDFRGIEKFEENISIGDVTKWKRSIKGKICNLAIVGRFDISAPGTQLLAYFSKNDMIPSQMFWCIKGLTKDDAKILTLWWNSSLNVIQILSQKKETRGAFMQLLACDMNNFKIINPKKLNDSQKKILLKTFDEISDSKFSSVLNQFDKREDLRKKIDSAMLEVLGMTGKIEQLINEIYPSIASEINQLKSVMK